MAKISKTEQAKAALKERAEKVLVEMRVIFAQLDDFERQELHKKLMEGYCPTCAHVFNEQCWNCFESHYDA